MKMPFFKRLLSLGNSGGMRADLPTPETPKVKAKPQTRPSYLKTAKPNPKAALQRDDMALVNTDITTFRRGADSYETLRNFRKASPDLSAAVASYARTAITNDYLALAKNADGTCNPEATMALHQIITRMNVLNDYSVGFEDSPSIRALAESWVYEIMTYGAMAGELVLDDALMPDKIQPVSITQIRLYPSSDGRKVKPKQKVGGDEIDLDVPTFFMTHLDQDLLTPYPESPMQSALQAVLFSAEFMNDIRRIVKKAIHPRVVVTINEEKFRAGIPPEMQSDPEKLTDYMNRVIEGLADNINGLEPEEALVVFDTIGIDVVDHGNTNLSNEYKVIQEMADAKMSTGAKVLPTVLGHSNGTSNVASTEALMFLKYVEGNAWGKLNEMFSKIFTLAVRLLGHDVYVEFQFEEINLRPKAELESFYAMRQSRILELLSLGLMTDEEASIRLTGKLPPAGAPKLAGTNFFKGGPQPAGSGYNGASNDGSTLNQNLKSDAPKGGARGSNKKADAEVISLR